MTSGVGKLKSSVFLFSSNPVKFHVQVEIHLEFSVNFQLMVQNN